MKRYFSEFLRIFDLHASGKWFLLASAIGVVAGLGAIAFQFLSHLVLHYALSSVTGFHPREAAGEHAVFEPEETPFQPWLIVVVMTGGGVVSGLLVYTFAPEAEGHGTDAAIDAFHNKRGQIRGRIGVVKTLASAITLGTGGSGGREGPIAQIGASFGSFLSQKLNLSARDTRILMAAGMGAGVGAIFRAPLAGALFAGEIMYRDADLESDVIVPTAISSIVAYSVFALSMPQEMWFTHLFGQGLTYRPSSLLELIPFGLMAIVLVLFAIVYIKTFYGVHHLFKKIPVPPHIKPAIGAAIAGLLGIGTFFWCGQNPQALAVLATGYGTLQDAITPGVTVSMAVLLIVAVVKILTTSLTISSGGSGGVFGPSMVIGGCIGTATGMFFQQTLFPELVKNPQMYGIVGMAGFFAACAHAPISTIIMVSEMTGDYNLLLPTMWTSTLCFLLCRRWSLYTKQVPTRLESPAHRGDFIVDVLEGILVKDVYRKDRKIRLVPEGTSLDDIVHKLATTHQHYFPVVDADEKVVGIFSADDVRSWLYDDSIWKLANARDVMVTNIVSVTPDDDLNTALRRFTALNIDEIPILDPANDDRLTGMLRRKEVIAAYNRRLMEYKVAAEESRSPVSSN
ncbi:chloride channel protein [Thalassoroseus pseudoceratinae]|uniref:chloride channel protein n=1 Tax=Thalassoroseus pseudoceratinae TaxID=2713176 RepID=UPI001F10C6FB|nr:chloride channel protein [Thalassoroseus pseudoceratinae]